MEAFPVIDFVKRAAHFAIPKFLLTLSTAFAVSLACGESPVSPPAVGYASFVCWDYSQLPRLRAWKESEQIIATTLAEAYPGLQNLSREENGSPDQLKDFLHKLPDEPGPFTVVYLAAHQSPSGQWNFPDRSVADWGTIMSGLPNLRNPRRIVLLDCCNAQATSRWPDWTRKVAPACLYASSANQLTPDLFVFWRRPVDWDELFPGASRWLRQHHVTGSDERLSFLGLVWLEAWTREPSPPRSMADWNNLGQVMTQIAQKASTQINEKFVSAISASFPP